MDGSAHIPGISVHPRGSVIALTVVPRSSVTELSVEPGEYLRVRIAAPPVDGAANKALLRFLADALSLSRSRLSIVSGEASKKKRVLVEGMPPDSVAFELSQSTTMRR
jgi:uncharacterized protein (TIGR00251 family)